MTALTVVAYNVLFGDAILVCIPERSGRETVMRHVLIDVGNVLHGRGGDSKVFSSIFNDINLRLAGQPIDLYVMTHEHMDHVKGLRYAKRNRIKLPNIDYAWLTASSNETYYDQFREAKQQRYNRVKSIAAQRGLLSAASVRSLLENNEPGSTEACVRVIRSLARKKTSYVYRGFEPVTGENHPFEETTFSIWAPEQNTASYYGRMRPVMQTRSGPKLKAPTGVKQDAFDALVEFSRSGLGDEMLAIDRSANNTSVVFSIEWRGWKLLFSGDAELRSWRTMEREKQLQPVHFLKVGHHASHNGTPSEEILERIFPLRRPGLRPRTALISTCKDIYNGVPDLDTQTRLEHRVNALVYTTDAPAVGSAIEIRFDDEEPH